jgi:hypothetical protein
MALSLLKSGVEWDIKGTLGISYKAFHYVGCLFKAGGSTR